MLNEKELQLYSRHIFQGEVIRNDNANDNGTIYVRVPELDQNINSDELAPCYPISNFQFFRILPKIGERVFIVLDRTLENTDIRNNQDKRYWLGISQSNVTNINYSPYFYSSNSHETDAWLTDKKNFKNIPFSPELELSVEDVNIRGRDNSDILFKPSELIFRAGRHVKNIPPLFNNKDTSFIQIKHQKQNLKDKKQLKNIKVERKVKYVIQLNQNDLNVLLKVYYKNNNSILETFNHVFTSIEQLIVDVNIIISKYKLKYLEWEFITDSEHFNDLENIYTPFNNTTVEYLETLTGDITYNSSINIVSDHINFLSHKSFSRSLIEGSNYVGENLQNEINNESERLVKGDKLLNLLNLLVLYVNNHTHPYPAMKPVNDLILKKINQFDLESIVNDYIRLG